MTQEMTQESLDIEQIFMEQARSLVTGGELIPGGIQVLAKRLQEAARTRTPLKVKLGLDPTRPDLHLGHSVVLRKLRAFQDLGHQAVLIIGDATAMIGDPSGRNQTRPPLTEEEVEINAKTYLDQAGKIIDVRKAHIVRNNDWFNTMNLDGFLKLSAKATVAQILAREDFSKRYESGTPISLHELFYPLMQGYDSVMVEADIELGGTDQRFNNLMGRELQLANRMSPQMVLLLPLLEGTDGKIKMSKSYPEHCINLTDSPEDLFGKIMSIPDALIPRYELLLTPITEEQLKTQLAAFDLPPEKGGVNPRDVKVHIAKWIISQYYSMDIAEEAEKNFATLFSKRDISQVVSELPLTLCPEALPLVELLVEQNLAPSKAEARRLIQGGGVRINEEKILDPAYHTTALIGQEFILQVGKRHFRRVLISV